MTRVDWALLLGGAGLAIAAFVYWRRSEPSAPRAAAAASPTGVVGSSGILGGLAPALDPQSLAVGTDSPDGRFYVTQTRQGSHYWTPGPNPFKTPEAQAFAAHLAGLSS